VSGVAAAKSQGASFTCFATNVKSSPPPQSKWGVRAPTCVSICAAHPHKSYIIFFRHVGEVLEIVRVIESHRDIHSLFGSDEQE